MEQTIWAPEHSDALRDCIARGLSFAESAEAINAKFNTAYTRSAAIGRAKRLGLGSEGWSAPIRGPKPHLSRLGEPRSIKPRPADFQWPIPVFERAEPLELRCADVDPRHLALVELEPCDCRYPYGGETEGEPITFCGHPRQPGSSYCPPHFLLTRSAEPADAEFDSATVRETAEP